MANSQIDRFRKLAKKYKLDGDDFFKQSKTDKRSGITKEIITMTRSGIDKIAVIEGITLRHEIVALDLEKGIAAVRTFATLGDTELQTFATATPNNNSNAYVLEMAEKRGRSRAVLMLTRFYELGVVGDGEIE